MQSTDAIEFVRGQTADTETQRQTRCLNLRVAYTLCSEKNTHSRSLLYLHGKCSHFHKIFRECLGGNL